MSEHNNAARTHLSIEGEAEIPGRTKVIFGPGKASTAITALMEEVGASRAFIITGRTLNRETNLIQSVVNGLGGHCAGVFDGMSQHTPRSAVIEASRRAKAAGADLLIGIGGGSPIVGSKGVALVMAEGENLDALKVQYDAVRKAFVAPKLDQPKLPVIAIPTTLTAGEFSSAMGITHDETGAKDIFFDQRIVPMAIVLDPIMTSGTPHRLWASTGVKALQNGIERYYSLNRNPFTEGLSLQAIRNITKHLKPSVDHPDDHEARGTMQFLNWMTTFGAGKGGIGLGHAICHQLGGVCDVPHGITGCIVLPQMMAYNLPVSAARQRDIADAMGIDTRGLDDNTSAEKAAAKVRELIAALGLPLRLRDVNVKREDLPKVAELTLLDRNVGAAPRKPADAAEVLELLERMY